MADRSKAKHEPVDEKEDLDDVPDPIDDGIRIELAQIYDTASRALLFVKTQQWWTVGSTLIVYIAFMGIAKLTGAGPAFVNKLTALLIVVACAAVFMLIIYQFWQHNELTRIQAVARHFSPAFQKIHGMKSKAEGDFHRYTLLIFMVVVVILGAVVTHLGLQEIVLRRNL